MGKILKLINKINNKKGSAESVMFIMGMLLFTVIVVFSLDIFDLTWQRYVVKRELGNISRLYAIKWPELYLKNDCDGNFTTCGTTPQNSKLAEDFKKIIETTIEEGNLNNAEIVVSRNAGANCNSAGVLMCVRADKQGNVTVTGQPWGVAKTTGYGDILYASINVNYTWDSTLMTPKKDSGYRINNKFASERQASDSSLIGS